MKAGLFSQHEKRAIPVAACGAARGLIQPTHPAFDRHAQGGGAGEAVYAAGESITISAGPPTSEGTPTSITLRVNGAIVATAPFPGTLTYVIPTAGPYSLQWNVNANAGNATWEV